jgi:hypothetical protein
LQGQIIADNVNINHCNDFINKINKIPDKKPGVFLEHLFSRQISCQLIFDGARDRNRTGTGFDPRRILSPVRLPVPPLGQSKAPGAKIF